MSAARRVGTIRPECDGNGIGAAEINRGNAYKLVDAVRRNRAADLSRDPVDAVDQGGGIAVTGRINCLGSRTIIKSPITDRDLGLRNCRKDSSGEHDLSQ